MNEFKNYLTWVPPGHYFSPIPDINQIRQKEDRIFDMSRRDFPGIDLNIEEQDKLFDEFKKYYKELPFLEHKVNYMRYFYENSAYSYSDAIILFCMIRHLKPKKIIEVGCGYSSCATLDTNELFFNDSINCTFIEPHPELLMNLKKKEDTLNIISSGLEDVPLSIFQSLEENDILFIDSTHVSKTGGDVNYLFFEVLPQLNKGVYIHFHDVFYPFEYPKNWVYEGRAWNELYLLRGFLQYNETFKIKYFMGLYTELFRAKIVRDMPLCEKNWGGNLWLQKCI